MNAALPKPEATHLLKWSKYSITFNSSDQFKCVTTAGALPMLCLPVISNVVVTKTLIDGGAGLNVLSVVLSVQTFDRLQVPYHHLHPTKPFSGVTDSSTHLIGQTRLPVTFGESDNYCTKLIDFDVADICLPYNAILGYPALVKFMAATHHNYNVLKMPGGNGIITVACKENDAVCSLERIYQAAVVENPEDEGGVLRPEIAPRTKKLQLGQGSREEASPDSAVLSLTSLARAPSPIS